MNTNIPLPKALEAHSNAVFPTEDTLDIAIDRIIRELPEVSKNKILKLLWIYHNTLINQMRLT